VTNSSYTDQQQGYAAGFCEGFATWDIINDAYYNYVNTVMNGNPTYSQDCIDFMQNQLQWIS
jgi:hypothetical protein